MVRKSMFNEALHIHTRQADGTNNEVEVNEVFWSH